MLLICAIVWLAGERLSAAEEPRAFLRRALDAVGGEATVRQARAHYMKAKGILHDLDGAHFEVEIFTELPERVRLDMDIGIGAMKWSYIQVLNGARLWIKSANENEVIDAATTRDTQLSAYVDYLATLAPLLQNTDIELTWRDNALVRGHGALVLHAKAKDKPEVLLFFDPQTTLLLKTEYRRRDAMTMKEIALEEYFSDYRAIDPTAADLALLKEAKVAVDDAGLLDFLRRQTMDETRRTKIKSLLQKLGDAKFQIREKAEEDLIAEGQIALPLLAQAMQDADPEVASRAKACLLKIGKAPDPEVAAAVVRLIGYRRPAGAVEVVLAYLPSAPGNTVLREANMTLASLAQQSGRNDPALVQALQDKDPQRRAAASAALGQGAGAKVPSGRRLLLPGLKQAMKGEQFRDGKKVMDWQISDVQYFDKLDERLFAKPE